MPSARPYASLCVITAQWEEKAAHGKGMGNMPREGPQGMWGLLPCPNVLPHPLRVPLGSGWGAWGYYVSTPWAMHELWCPYSQDMNPSPSHHSALCSPQLRSGGLGNVPEPTTPLHGPAWGHPGELTRQEHFPLGALLVHEN